MGTQKSKIWAVEQEKTHELKLQFAIEAILFFVLLSPSKLLALTPEQAGWEGGKTGLAQAFLMTLAVVVWVVGREVYRRIKSRIQTGTKVVVKEVHPPTEEPQSTDASVAGSNINQENAYATVAFELESGKTDKGLWTRCFAECEGDDTKTKVLYIKRRVELLSIQARVHEDKKQPAEKILMRPTSEFLSRDDIKYLGTPIKAFHYLAKYSVSKDELANACANKLINSVMHNGILWVSDRPLIASRKKLSSLHIFILVSVIFLVITFAVIFK